MYLLSILSAILASSSLAAALPSTPTVDRSSADLRLIKTSEADPGTWVTEDQKIDDYVAKSINFIDITDITNATTLQRLSGNAIQARQQAAAVAYPTTLTHQAQATPLIAQVTTTGPKSWLLTLTDYYNRYYRSTYGTQAGTWLLSQVKTIAAANSAITVSTFAHSFNQPSIIVKIPGTSSNLVIVGAHYDSTGGSTTARGPGADDDGSGVVTILEALRVLAGAKFAPKNTLEFHFYAGEEGGLLGSQAVFASYAAAGKTVLAFVNQDMTGYSPSGKVSVYTDYVDASLTAYVRRIVALYTGVASSSDTCGYGCSDHASAYANGFREFARGTSPSFCGNLVLIYSSPSLAAAYVCDEVIKTSSPYIHSPSDTYSTIMWDAILRHAKFTVGFLVEASYL
ncbi:Leucine aminopeptidase 1-like protein 1 [Phlyctema vagabunda]|uniref:Peptide hydrolase n=1 Tax=Phlyctema vagabunda TaxID=108571 RepID=A0ABR4P2Z9_9HELO